MKRVADVAIAIPSLILLSPALALVGLLVKITSPGPILFRQLRVGRNNTLFEILKFRSMTTTTQDGMLVTAAGDTRITPVGHVLRQSKIDELPQLWNVIRGDMSLVGPRPEVERYVDLWAPEQRKIILSVRPGITDPASLQFRDEAKLLRSFADPEAAYRELVLPRKAAVYVRYVESQSLLGDLKLILATIGALLPSFGGRRTQRG